MCAGEHHAARLFTIWGFAGAAPARTRAGFTMQRTPFLPGIFARHSSRLLVPSLFCMGLATKPCRAGATVQGARGWVCWVCGCGCVWGRGGGLCSDDERCRHVGKTPAGPFRGLQAGLARPAASTAHAVQGFGAQTYKGVVLAPRAPLLPEPRHRDPAHTATGSQPSTG